MELLRVISHSQMILQWQENLLSEEMPPAWMWPFDDEIEGWFREVNRARDNGGSGPEPRTDASEMMDNQLAKTWGK